MLKVEKYLALFFAITTVVPVSVCEEKYPVSTYATCDLQEQLFGPVFHSLALVHEIGNEKPSDIQDETIVCSILDQKQLQRRFISLDIVVAGNPPSMISVQVPNMILTELESSLIICSYNDIGAKNRVHNTTLASGSPTTENANYLCDITGLQIIFTGILNDRPVESTRKIRSNPQKETYEVDTRCSNFSTKSNEPFPLLGTWCTVTASDQTIGRRWMFDENKQPDCLSCCENFFWDEDAQHCEICAPGFEQRKQNAWRHCVPSPKVKSEAPLGGSPLDPNLGNPPARSTSTPTTLITDEPPDPSIEMLDLEPRINQPFLTPSNLKVVKLGTHYATINWVAVPSAPAEPVTKYKVTVINLNWTDARYIETEKNETTITLPDLSPDALYAAKIHAGNSAGFGPASDSLMVHTLRELRALQDVRPDTGENGLVTIEWTLRSKEKELNTTVEYWVAGLSSPPTVHRVKLNGHGTASFRLVVHGLYDAQIFYVSGNREGPRSQVFQLQYKKEQWSSIAQYISQYVLYIAYAAVGFLCIAVAVIVWGKKKLNPES